MRFLHWIINILLLIILLSACSVPKKLPVNRHTRVTEQIVEVNPDIPTEEELAIVDDIKSQSIGILRKAFVIEEKHRKLTLQELRSLLGILKERFANSNLSKEEFEQRLYNRLTRDMEIINSLNEHLSKIKSNVQDRALYLCKENKLDSIITGSAGIIRNHINDLIQGKMPIEFKKSIYDITTLGTYKGGEILTGSFKTTCLKGVIVTMLVELQGQNASASNINIPGHNGNAWVDYSLIFHTIPLTTKIMKSSVHPEFDSFTYYYKDKLSPQNGELGFPHSGYYVGGDYTRNSNRKLSIPEDCSSWVSKILGTKYDITTYNLMQYFRIKSKSGMSDKFWADSQEFKYIETLLDPIQITNMQEDVKPGDVLCIRRPKEGEKVYRSSSYGDSGHMAIALFVTNTHIIAIACTRDTPIMEGIGIQKINLETERNSDIMFLRPRSSLQLRAIETIMRHNQENTLDYFNQTFGYID